MLIYSHCLPIALVQICLQNALQKPWKEVAGSNGGCSKSVMSPIMPILTPHICMCGYD